MRVYEVYIDRPVAGHSIYIPLSVQKQGRYKYKSQVNAHCAKDEAIRDDDCVMYALAALIISSLGQFGQLNQMNYETSSFNIFFARHLNEKPTRHTWTKWIIVECRN